LSEQIARQEDYKTMAKKLFVGNISYRATEFDLRLIDYELCPELSVHLPLKISHKLIVFLYYPI